jgi:hypothetical protein
MLRQVRGQRERVYTTALRQTVTQRQDIFWRLTLTNEQIKARRDKAVHGADHSQGKKPSTACKAGCAPKTLCLGHETQILAAVGKGRRSPGGHSVCAVDLISSTLIGKAY